MKSIMALIVLLILFLTVPLCRGQTVGGQWTAADGSISMSLELQKFKNVRGVPFYVDQRTGRVLVDIGTNITIVGTVMTLTNVSAMLAGVTGSIPVSQTNSIPAGTAHIGEVSVPVSTNYVGGFTSICKGAISNDTSASYGIGDVYAAIFTCTNAARTAGGGVTWQSFKLFTGDDAQFDFEVFMFTQIPASLGNSNTVWAVSTADLASYCCGKITSLDFPNGWSDLGTNRMFVADFVKAMQAAPGTNDLFMAIRTLSTAVQGTNQPSVRLGFWPD